MEHTSLVCSLLCIWNMAYSALGSTWQLQHAIAMYTYISFLAVYFRLAVADDSKDVLRKCLAELPPSAH